jgi:hypothetical protein
MLLVINQPGTSWKTTATITHRQIHHTQIWAFFVTAAIPIAIYISEPLRPNHTQPPTSTCTRTNNPSSPPRHHRASQQQLAPPPHTQPQRLQRLLPKQWCNNTFKTSLPSKQPFWVSSGLSPAGSSYATYSTTKTATAAFKTGIP